MRIPVHVKSKPAVNRKKIPKENFTKIILIFTSINFRVYLNFEMDELQRFRFFNTFMK